MSAQMLIQLYAPDLIDVVEPFVKAVAKFETDVAEFFEDQSGPDDSLPQGSDFQRGVQLQIARVRVTFGDLVEKIGERLGSAGAPS